MKTSDSINAFLQSADAGLISAVTTACRRRFPRTVEVLSSLSDLELSAIKNGGLLALPKPKIEGLKKAMQKDKFVWN